jgi:hypothetical protein
VTASVTVYFNTVNVDVDMGTPIKAKETFFDPGFDINNLGSHDSGLVHLESAAPSTITPMPVNFLHDKAPIGISVTQIGFGTRQVGAQGPAGAEYFLDDQVSVSCASLFDGDDNALLCFSQTDGKGKCEGDSGGPSLAMVGSAQMLVGITSFGDENCAQYGADTRPEAEKSFILEHVPGIECQTDDQCEGSNITCYQTSCVAAPFTPRGAGSACTGNGDCDSKKCASGPGVGSSDLCVLSCTPNDSSTCPDGFDCLAAGSNEGACWPAADNDTGGGGGGCDAGEHGAGAAALLVGIGLIGLVLRRKRR